jgi:RNA polymerase sigma-70 factor, ECF subfamily
METRGRNWHNIARAPLPSTCRGRHPDSTGEFRRFRRLNSEHDDAATPSSRDLHDNELMRQLAAGKQEALGELYSRHARLIFSVAARSLDRAAAEEVVQDVFLAVWRKTAVFTPDRGTFRSWVMQIAHRQILNEFRRRRRRPQEESDPGDQRIANLPDDSIELEEVVWHASFRSAVESSLAELPQPQRAVLDLALFADLTHKQVAAELNLPVGTAKTRIRIGLQNLRGKLAPFVAALSG